MTVRRFEDLVVWQRAHGLALCVYSVSRGLGRVREYDLQRQLRRSAVSVPSNIAEGFERGARREFIQFLGIAKGSCGELRSQLLLTSDLGLLSREALEPVVRESAEISRLIAGFIRYLNRSNIPGIRLKDERSG